MNQAQKQAILNAIGNVEDNLYRARLQQKADPNWVSGNGESIDQMIANYEKQLLELRAI